MLIVRLDQKAKNMQRPKGGNEISQRHSETSSISVYQILPINTYQLIILGNTYLPKIKTHLSISY